jgi:parvulin-like peptidyl-prolyl isomerase
MKVKFTLIAACAAVAFSHGAFAQSQEATTNDLVTNPTTNVEVITTSEAKTIRAATPVNKTGKPIKSESIMDRQKKADSRVSKREPKK